MNFRLEESLDWKEVDAFLEEATGASFFHHSTWLSGLSEIYGMKISALSLRREGRLRALLPFAERSRWGLRIQESLPFGTYGGPLLAPGEKSELGEHLLEAALGRVSGRRVLARVFLKPGDKAELASESLSTYRVDLREGWDEIFTKRFAAGKRRQVRQAREAGLVTGESREDRDLEEYYALYLANTKRWKLKNPVPLSLLKHLLKDESHVRLWLARHEGRIVSGMLNFQWGQEEIYWQGSSLEEARNLRPSALLYAAVLEDACRRNLDYFNLGASPNLPSLARYKMDFGAEEIPCTLLEREAPWFRRLRSRRKA